jgi:hypothetical protein
MRILSGGEAGRVQLQGPLLPELRRMAETAALLVDEVLPQVPIRQWVLSLPFALRYLLATRPEVITQVLGIVYRAISGHLIKKAGLTRASAATGAVTLIQRFGRHSTLTSIFTCSCSTSGSAVRWSEKA